MGFLDYFFKKKENKTPEISKINFNEISDFLKSEKSKIQEIEKKYSSTIKNEVANLIPRLEEHLSVLREINLEGKKVEEKIKLIVRENLGNYIEYLERLIKKLKEIKNEENIVDKINSTFLDFKSKSRMSYEKATFIIGKELGDTKETISKFFKELETITDENKNSIQKSSIIKKVNEELNKTNELNKIKIDIESNIDNYNSNISEFENKKEQNNKLISSLKESKEYQKEIELRQEIEKSISSLKELIDFKILTSFYHIFENEMKIVKSYKENFKESFSKNQGKDLLELLINAKMESDKVENKINDIRNKSEEYSKLNLVKNKIENLNSLNKKLNLEIEETISKKQIMERKLEKIKEDINQIKNNIEKELIKLNIELINN